MSLISEVCADAEIANNAADAAKTNFANVFMFLLSGEIFRRKLCAIDTKK